MERTLETVKQQIDTLLEEKNFITAAKNTCPVAESAVDRCLYVCCRFGSPISLVNVIQKSEFPLRHKVFWGDLRRMGWKNDTGCVAFGAQVW